MKRIILAMAAILVSVTIFSSSAKCENEKQAGTVNVDFFLMSQCPYASQVGNVFYMLSERLKDKMQFNLYFIAESDAKGNILTLRGPNEIDEDMRQLIIKKYFPDKFWQYFSSRNTDYASSEWKSHAFIAGIDTGELEKLVASEGKAMLLENIKKSNELKIKNSPTIYINGKKYEGLRNLPSLYIELTKNLGGQTAAAGFPACFSDANCQQPGSIGICRSPGTIQAKCEQVEVDLKIVDVQDKAYLMDQPYKSLKQFAPGIRESFVNYRSGEGKKLIKETGAKSLPIYLISSSAKKVQKLDWLLLQLLQPNQNNIKIGKEEFLLINSKKGPARLYLDRKHSKKQLDLFVMSQCPFGMDAERVIYPVAKQNKIKLNINYIANFSTNPDASAKKQYAITSLHGAAEVEEDSRQLCVKKLFEPKLMDYILARNKETDNSQWEKVAAEILGADSVEAIKKCQAEEGEALLQKNMVQAVELGINSSPTILWENQRRFESLKELKEEVSAFKDIEIKSSGSCK